MSPSNLCNREKKRLLDDDGFISSQSWPIPQTCISFGFRHRVFSFPIPTATSLWRCLVFFQRLAQTNIANFLNLLVCSYLTCSNNASWSSSSEGRRPSSGSMSLKPSRTSRWEEKKNLVFSTAAAASLYLIFLLLDRSSYRITRTTIIFWWASHPKSLTRSGKNPLAA